MSHAAGDSRQQIVASHTGCVSRNFDGLTQEQAAEKVASHTGCVSRNASAGAMSLEESGRIPHGMCE